jgi:phage shock protein B
MEAPEFMMGMTAIIAIFVGLPWLILHYTTKWRQAKTLTREDENLLDALYETARRLEDRVITVERIMAAENPNWKTGG